VEVEDWRMDLKDENYLHLGIFLAESYSLQEGRYA